MSTAESFFPYVNDIKIMNTRANTDRNANLSASRQPDRMCRYCNILSMVSEIVAAVLLIAIVGMNLAQIFFRYVLVDPLSWTEEAMRYSATWMTFLLVAPALVRGEHMVIDLFRGVRSLKLRRFVRYLVLLCVGGFCVLLIWKGFAAAIGNMKQVSPAVRISMAIPYAAVPVGAGLTLIQIICTMLNKDSTQC